MIETTIAELIRTHRIEQGMEYYNIYLNKPDDFIYETSNIIVRYYPRTHEKIVICNEIPESIKENIHKFRSLELKEFVTFLEQNLTTFLMGKVPELCKEEDEVLLQGELPNNFKFPTHNNVTSNLRCDISKVNILLLCCMSPSVVVKCTKCEEVSTIPSVSSCRRCNQDIGMVYVPVIENGSLGFLQLKKCVFVCFNPAKYQFSCALCGKAYESLEIGQGNIYSRKCTGCFREMKIKVNKIDYFVKRDVKIKEGEELPEKGTCKHYKKSYRWFRFSCCQSLFPCDICHNEQSGHPAETATRMVCGLCSKEQSVKQECDCGMNLKKRHTQFWEGGKGNRDKVTMSKKENKKYK